MVDDILKIVAISFFIVSAYAMLQQVFGIGAVQVPGLTVNYTDYADNGPLWYTQKNNGVTSSDQKIISTYQNGNVFGSSLVLMFPLVFCYLFKRYNRIAIMSVVLFSITGALTLSRTCWLGIAIVFSLASLWFAKRARTKLLLCVSAIILSFLGIFILSVCFPTVSERITATDASAITRAGGRIEPLTRLIGSTVNTGFLPLSLLLGPFGLIEQDGFAYEMTPFAILNFSGIIGLMIWLLSVFSGFRDSYHVSDSTKRIVAGGTIAVVAWFIMATIDGSYWTPPTALNLFTIIALVQVAKNTKERSGKNAYC